MKLSIKYYAGKLASRSDEKLEYVVVYDTNELPATIVNDKRWIRTLEFDTRKTKMKNYWSASMDLDVPEWFSRALTGAVRVPADYGLWFVAVVSSPSEVGFYGNRTAGYGFLPLFLLVNGAVQKRMKRYSLDLIAPPLPFTNQSFPKGILEITPRFGARESFAFVRFTSMEPYTYSKITSDFHYTIMMQNISRTMAPFTTPDPRDPLLPASTNESIAMHAPLISLPTGIMPSVHYMDFSFDTKPDEASFSHLANLALQRSGCGGFRGAIIETILQPREITNTEDERKTNLTLLHFACRTLGIFCTLIPTAMTYIGDFVDVRRRDRMRRVDQSVRALGEHVGADYWENGTLMASGDCDELNVTSALLGATILLSTRWTSKLLQALQRLAGYYVNCCCVCTVSRPSIGTTDAHGEPTKVFIDTPAYKAQFGGGHFANLLIPKHFMETALNRTKKSGAPIVLPLPIRDPDTPWWARYLHVITCEGTGKLDPMQLPLRTYIEGRDASPEARTHEPRNLSDIVLERRARAMRKDGDLELEDANDTLSATSFKTIERLRRDALRTALTQLRRGMSSYWSAYIPQKHDLDVDGMSLSSFYREFTHLFTFQPRMSNNTTRKEMLPVELLFVEVSGDRQQPNRPQWMNGVNYRHILTMSQRVGLIAVPAETQIESDVIDMHKRQRSPIVLPTSKRPATFDADVGFVKSVVENTGIPWQAPTAKKSGNVRVRLYAKLDFLLQIQTQLPKDMERLAQELKRASEIEAFWMNVEHVGTFDLNPTQLSLAEVVLTVDVNTRTFKDRVSPRMR